MREASAFQVDTLSCSAYFSAGGGSGGDGVLRLAIVHDDLRLIP